MTLGCQDRGRTHTATNQVKLNLGGLHKTSIGCKIQPNQGEAPWLLQ
jgi:hypothetical protein